MANIARTEIFQLASRYTLSPGTVGIVPGYVTGYATLLAPQTIGTIEFNEEYEASALVSLAETVSKPAGTNIIYQLRIGGNLYYWNGAAWANPGTNVANGNTIATINANVGTLPISGTGSKLKILAILSGTTVAQPQLQSFTTTFTQTFVTPSVVSKCTVHVNMRDLTGAAWDNSSAGEFWCRADAPIGQSGGLYIGDSQKATFVADASSISVPNTETSGKKVVFYVSYTYQGKRNVIKFYPCVVPDRASINLLDLTDPTTEVA